MRRMVTEVTIQMIGFLILLQILLVEADDLQKKSCDIGYYYLIQKGDCEPCYEGCGTCTTSEQKDCLTCLDTYVLKQIKNQILCLKCTPGQYYDNTTQSCMSCDYNCDLCYDFTTCLICKEGYLYDYSKQTCSTRCDIYYYPNAITNRCERCPKESYTRYCYQKIYQSGSTQTSVIWALSCIDGLILNSTVCVCPPSTYMDTSVYPPICRACTDPNCFICTAINQCSYCKYQYLTYQNKQCVQTIPSTSHGQYSFTTYFSFSIQTSQDIGLKQRNDGSYYCTGFTSYYLNAQGCFYNCPPYTFKLFLSDRNSFLCVEFCPKDYTLNLQALACIKNDCTSDISVSTSQGCFYRNCPQNQYFTQYASDTIFSSCATISVPNCLSQNDEVSTCIECSISFIKTSSSQCLQTCQTNQYISANSLNSCNGSCTGTSYCQNSLAFPTSSCCVLTCPRGYTLINNLCQRCTDLTQLECNTGSQQVFLCEWGQDASTSSCSTVSTLTNKQYLSLKGIITTSSTVVCSDYDSILSYCNTCNNQYFNINGVCTEGFSTSTQYFVMPDPSEFNVKQYKVIRQCPDGYFVQKRNIQNITYRYCKQFIQSITSIYDDQQLKYTSCSPGFYLLNGNCIDDCPSYTYKNTSKYECQSLIEQCAMYSGQLCQYCFFGYVVNYDNKSCILPSQCQIGQGYTLSFTNYACIKCPDNCDTCDRTGTCQQPSNGYFLYTYNSVSLCNKQTDSYYYGDQTTRECVKCSELCNKCSDSETCSQTYSNKEVQLINSTPYVTNIPYCSSGMFYDQISKTCLYCSTACKECYQKADQCMICMDTTQVLETFQCLSQCPSGKYAIDYSLTSSINQKFCNQCDVTCAECQDTSTFCTKCAAGFIFHRNTCLLVCPDGYLAVNGVCNIACSEGYFRKSIDECSPCFDGCASCVDTTTCIQCKTGLLLNNNKCQKQCDENYKINPKLPNECKPCSIYNCDYCQLDSSIICEKCSSGYALKNNRYCWVETDDPTKEPSESGENGGKDPTNEVIDYSGTIYEGDQCHFTCTKCKGNKLNECLSCKSSEHIFFEKTYCMCPDNSFQNDDKNCNKGSSSILILSLADTISNWLILATIFLNKMPIFSIQMLDILSLGSYQIYFEFLFNFIGKYDILKVVDQSNFSKMMPNFLKTSHMQDIGTTETKLMLNFEENQKIDDPMRFANLSSLYLFNALPYLLMMAIGILTLLTLRLSKPHYFSQIYSNCLILFQYFTFQDQILFIGLQLKFLKFMSSPYVIMSITFLAANIIFNLYCLYQLYKCYLDFEYQNSESPFKQLITLSSIITGLVIKLINALNLLITPIEYRSYIFVGIIGVKFIIEVYNIQMIDPIRGFKNIYKILRYFIAFQVVLFFTPALQQKGQLTNQILDDEFIHRIQMAILLGMVIEKCIISVLEIIFVVVQQPLYISLLKNVFLRSQTKDQISTGHLELSCFSIQDLEAILSKKPKPIKQKLF